MDIMTDQETSSEPTLMTKHGNTVVVHPGGIYIEGNNNNIIKDSHDITINIDEQSKSDQGGGDQHTQGVNKGKEVRKILLRLCANSEDFSLEQNELLLQKISDVESMMRKIGPNLRCISLGSLTFTVSVNDTYALENLMECHKNGRFIRGLAEIFGTENQVEDFCKTWSSHIDEQTYETVLGKLNTVEQSSNRNRISEWNRGHVRKWLASEMCLKDEIVKKVYEQEITGTNLLVYEVEEFVKDFNIKTTDGRMIQYSLEEKMVDALKVLWEPVTYDCTATNVSELLETAGLLPIHVEKFTNLDMTGRKFLKYRKEHLKKDFNLTIGPLRLVLHMQKMSKIQFNSTNAGTTSSVMPTTPEITDETSLKELDRSLTSTCKSQNIRKIDIQNVQIEDVERNPQDIQNVQIEDVERHPQAIQKVQVEDVERHPQAIQKVQVEDVERHPQAIQKVQVEDVERHPQAIQKVQVEDVERHPQAIQKVQVEDVERHPQAIQKVQVEDVERHPQAIQKVQVKDVERHSQDIQKVQVEDVERHPQAIQKVQVEDVERHPQAIQKVQVEDVERHPQAIQKVQVEDVKRHSQDIQKVQVEDVERHPQAIQKVQVEDVERHTQAIQKVQVEDVERHPQDIQKVQVEDVERHPQAIQKVQVEDVEGHPQAIQKVQVEDVERHPQDTQKIQVEDVKRHPQAIQKVQVEDVERYPQAIQKVQVEDVERHPQAIQKVQVEDVERHPQDTQKIQVEDVKRHPQDIQKVQVEDVERHPQAIQKVQVEDVERHPQAIQKVQVEDVERHSKDIQKVQVEDVERHPQAIQKVQVEDVERHPQDIQKVQVEDVERHPQAIQKVQVEDVERHPQDIQKVQVEDVERHPQAIQKVQVEDVERHPQAIQKVQVEDVERHPQDIQKVQVEDVKRHPQAIQKVQVEDVERHPQAIQKVQVEDVEGHPQAIQKVQVEDVERHPQDTQKIQVEDVKRHPQAIQKVQVEDVERHPQDIQKVQVENVERHPQDTQKIQVESTGLRYKLLGKTTPRMSDTHALGPIPALGPHESVRMTSDGSEINNTIMNKVDYSEKSLSERMKENLKKDGVQRKNDEKMRKVVVTSKVDTKDTLSTKPKKKKKTKRTIVSPPVLSFSEAEQRVRDLLLGKTQLNVTFDKMYDSIMVANDPSEEMQCDLTESFEFISKVKWKAVFDFDASSNKTGICKVMRSTQEIKLYDIKDLNDVKTPSEISYAEVAAWIFSNGRTDIETYAMDRMTWIKERSHDMDKAVEFFSNTSVIRRDTGLIIFMLLSNNISVLSEAFRKFYTDFGIHRIVFISENTHVFDEWCTLVSKYCKQEELHNRAIVGVTWKSLNDIILRMQGVNVKSDYTLRTVVGECPLWEKDRSRWFDLSVVTHNECDNTDMNEEHPDFERFCKERELDFYKGEKLTFWNFKLTDMGCDHVCHRDVKDEITRQVDRNINQPMQQLKKTNGAVFYWFHLYHQPGAGGSTVVKHVLWEFRRKYRCVVLNKITDQTEAQILEMWNYGEIDRNGERECLPLLIVSDNLGYDDLTDMIISLEYKTKNCPGHTCIILNCRRYLSRKDIKTENSVSVFFLEQSLSDREREWFQSKHNQLEKKMKTDKDFRPDRLLGFMVMKEEFKAEFIEKTVGRVLNDLKDQHPHEFELVKFCSLFSKFERDTAIPIPCCDKFMGFAFSVNKGRECPWEYDRSEGSSLLMITVDIHEVGSVQGFKIVHPAVADFILKDATSEPLNLIVTNYLRSDLLTAISHSREYLAARTHDLLIKRNQTGRVQSTKQQFSALILTIKDNNKEDACKVLIQGFETLKDPMIAQQIARYYNLVMEDCTKALEFIEKAIDMKPENSFLWDTKGQIYRNELFRSFYHKYVVRHELISIDESFGLMKLAFNGIDSFHKSQSLNRIDSMSSFSGEVDITFKMLDVLTCLDIFRKSADGRKILQRYLVDQSYKPDELSKWAEHKNAMKGLMRNVQAAIDTQINYFTFQKEWSKFTQIGRSKVEDLKHKVTTYLGDWETHFGSIQIEDMTAVPAETADDLRRLKARRLGGYSSGRIFDLAKEDSLEDLLEIRNLLLTNNPYSAFDLKTIILTNLALSAAVNMKKCRFHLPSIKEMIDLAKEFDQCDRKEGDFSLYAPVFLLMLLWPRSQPAEEYDNSLMKKSLGEIRQRWSASQRQNREEDGHASLHPVYGRHLKNQRIRKKPLVRFFLGSGKGLKALVHQSRISSNHKKIDGEQVWQNPYVRENLLKVDGILSENNNIIFKHEYTDESIQIPLASASDRITSREEVVFYIGFSWGGPVAYYVKPKRMSLVEPIGHNHCRPSAHHLPMKSAKKPVSSQLSVPEYQKKYNNLKKKLNDIEELETKARQGKKLEKNQEVKVARKQELTQQMMKLEDEFKKQIEMMETSLGQ